MNEPYNPLQGVSTSLPPDKTAVTICVEEGFIFKGNIRHIPQQRILDALNRGIVTGQLRASKDFVLLTESEVFNRDGQMIGNSSACYVSKSNILFAVVNKAHIIFVTEAS